jgi:leucyl aminopeptidase
MHWTQEKYKTSHLIELSTLTGAIIFALGHKYAGLFGNDKGLNSDLKLAGEQIHEECWEMPLNSYYKELVQHKYADITNSSGKSEAGSCQAAAFLNVLNF